MVKHLFVINPVAGKHSAVKDLVPQIHAIFNGSPDTYDIFITEYAGHAPLLIRSYLADNKHETVRVYACGGDGTLNEAVNGAVGFDNVLIAHYPCGTGNDFIKLFGAHSLRFRDLRELVCGETVKLDLIQCSGRYAINICTTGLDSRIAASVSRYKRIPFISGKAPYIIALVENFFKGIHNSHRVTIDDISYDGRHTMLVAANARYYGGGFNPVPEAIPDDGLLDFLIVKDVSRFEIAKLIKLYEEGRHAEVPHLIRHIRGKRMVVQSDIPISINLDGEVYTDYSVVFEIAECKINFIVPKDAQWNSENAIMREIRRNIK